MRIAQKISMHLKFAALILLLSCVICVSPAQLSQLDVPVEINPDALLAHLPLINDLRDLSPQHHETDTEGAVELRDGAAWFVGNGSWLELPHLSLNGSSFSIAMWIKITGGPGNYGLFEQRAASAPNQHLHLMLRGTLQPYLGFLGNDALSPMEIPTNQWTHLVFQFTGSRQEIWIDGQLVCERRASAFAGTTGLTRLGRAPRWNNVSTRDFVGAMRDLRIYRRALSRDEIARLGKAPSAENEFPTLSMDGITLTIKGRSGQVHELEVSNQADGPWKRLTILTNITGRVKCLDPGADNSGERYYRLHTR